MQVPPTGPRSTTAVFHPALANASARGLPPCPVPRMIASKRSAVLDDMAGLPGDGGVVRCGTRGSLYLRCGRPERGSTAPPSGRDPYILSAKGAVPSRTVRGGQENTRDNYRSLVGVGLLPEILAAEVELGR